MVDRLRYQVHTIMYQIYNNIEILDSNILIDHIDGNRSNNSKDNLRISNNSTNAYNRKTYNKTGFRGVFKQNNRYKSIIGYNNKLHHLGYFSTKEEAALAYDKAALYYFGEFAILNFTTGGDSL